MIVHEVSLGRRRRQRIGDAEDYRDAHPSIHLSAPAHTRTKSPFLDSCDGGCIESRMGAFEDYCVKHASSGIDDKIDDDSG